MRAVWTGLDAFRDFVVRVEQKAKDTAPLMRLVAEHGRSTAVEHVESGRYEGGVGVPLSPATVAGKGSSLPLVDTGRYLASVNVRYGRDYAAWGSNDKRARLLHEGGTVTPKTARFLAFPPDRAARRLVRRYGSPRDAVAGLRADGVRVWTRVNAAGTAGVVLYARAKGGEGRVLLVLKKSVTVPPRRHFYLDRREGQEIARIAASWLEGAVL